MDGAREGGEGAGWKMEGGKTQNRDVGINEKD